MRLGGSAYIPPAEVFEASKTSVGRLFSAAALLNKDKTAVIENDRTMTYRELNTRVNQLANIFLDRGIKTGDRIALLARNSIAFIEVELAAAKIGAITVSLNWRWTTTEIAHCIKLTTPAQIITTREFNASFEKLGVRPDFIIGSTYEALIQRASSEEPEIQVEAEDGLVIIFTSGTTGLPKGALISHRAMIARAFIFASEYQVPDRDTFIAWSPLFHMGSNDFAFATLLRGGQVVVIDGYQPEQIIRIIERFSVHYLTVVPGMIEDFITHLKMAKTKPKKIGMIGAMADLVPRALLKEITTLLNAPYLNTFGSTETGNPPASGNFVAIGTTPNSLSKSQSRFCEIRLVDSRDEDVSDGEPGELAIRGPSLFSGYWGNDNANQEAFRNGWFHMGDVFRRTPDGLLDFVDRVKYMIKSGGENIYPAEIEQYLMADKRISEVAVVRKLHEKWGEIPVVFVSTNDKELTEKDVINITRGKIANYKLPKEVHFIDIEEFPRTETGKIQRHKLENYLTDLNKD